MMMTAQYKVTSLFLLLTTYLKVVIGQQVSLSGDLYQKLQANQVIKGDLSAIYDNNSQLKCGLK